jgi:hypothetical protein
VAVEWLAVGLAVGKILLRAADKENIADALDDARGGWAALRRDHSRDEAAMGAAIASELEKHLGGVSSAVEDDLRAAAQAVADLLNRLAKDDDAVIAARIHPDQFLDYARRHGGNRERRLIAEGAESAFDQILEVASAEFTRLAPGSSRFSDSALAEIVRQVRTVAAHALRAAEGMDELRSAPYAKAWAVLDGLARRLREGVRSDLAAGDMRLELPRHGERARLIKAMTNAGQQGSALVVTGEPDVGKSALTLRAAEDVGSDGMSVTSLSLRDLPALVLELEKLLGMSAPELLGASEVRPLQLLVVDGAEAVLEGRREVFHEVVMAARRAGTGIVAVTRADGANRVREVLQAASSLAGKAEAPVEHVVARLTPAERQTLVETFGSLIRLTADPHAEWLVGRPGLVDVLLRAGTGFDSTKMLSEADVFVAVWNGLIRNHEELTPDRTSPDDRENAVLAVAARALGVSVGVVPSGGVWAGLRSDGVLRTPANPALASGDEFATDLIRDFALCRLFLRSGWNPLRAAGAPRWTIRAVRLACQAKLVAIDRAAVWRELRQEFNRLRLVEGERWGELPVEALLTIGDSQAAIEQVWDELVADGQAGLKTLLRLGRLRYVKNTFGDPFALAPVVAATFCSDRDLGQHDRYSYGGIGGAIRELVLAWLRGMAREDRGPHPLRQQVRNLILASDPESHDEFSVEALAMLGRDIDDVSEQWLRRLATKHPHRLEPAIESIGVELGLSKARPQLLLDLTEAYYIEHPDPNRHPWGGAEPLGQGIRHHRSSGLGSPLAAWYHGPFFSLLNALPTATVAMINRMLDHAARFRRSWPSFDEPSENVDGIDLDIPDIGPRHYVGDVNVWSWYRGSTVGPYPCMSALLAVERFADYLFAGLNVSLRRIVHLLLRDCHNLAMPGLVLGLLIRHLEEGDNLLDVWLTHPAVWSLEFSRATSEGHLHVQGPDPQDMVGRDRRRLTPRDVAAKMTLKASAASDQPRLDALATVADRLVVNAQAELEGDPDRGDRLVLVEGWASMFRPENYTAYRSDDGSIVVEHEPPEPVAAALTPTAVELNIRREAMRLLSTYSDRNHLFSDRNSLLRSSHPETPIADIALARQLAANDPVRRSLYPLDPVAAVAAAVTISHAFGRATAGDDDLRWAADTVLTAANPPVDVMSHKSTYPMDGVLAAAKSVPSLLLDEFDHLALDPSRMEDAMTALATRTSPEVQSTFVTGCSPVWRAPCNPDAESETACRRHGPSWRAAQAGLADCRLGAWNQHAQRRPEYLPPPYADTLPAVPATNLLVNRLAMPIACAASARAAPCIRSEAAATLEVLLAAHCRGADHWIREGYGGYEEQQRELVARVLIDLATEGKPEPLIEHLRTFAANADALQQLLGDFVTLFSYDSELRRALPAIWPLVLQTTLDAIDAGADLHGDGHWGEYALAALLPTPQPRIGDPNPDNILNAARLDWLPPEALDGLIDRWITVATGEPKAADAVAQFARAASISWQTTTGLDWLDRIIHNRYEGFAGHCWFVTHWLGELRETTALAPHAFRRWRRIVDGLAAAGDRRGVELQRIDE